MHLNPGALTFISHCHRIGVYSASIRPITHYFQTCLRKIVFNMGSLYPLVQDLTEYEDPCGYCCGDAKFGPFKLSSLAKPTSNEPLTYHSNTPKGPKTHRRDRTRTNRSIGALLDRAESPTQSIHSEDDPARFADSYVLTKIIESRLRCDLWECVDRQTNHQYCVKVYDMNKLRSSGDRIAARREALLLQKCQGMKHIVKLRNIFDEPEKLFIVTELLRPLSLSDLLLKKATLPETQVKTLARPLLDAVKVLHEVGISHNSIEPSNILFNKQGAPILCDFSDASEPKPGMPLSSDVASFDIKCIGLVLYECLYGYRPTSKDMQVRRFLARHDNCTRAAKRFLNRCFHMNEKTEPPTIKELQNHSWLQETPSRSIFLPRLPFRKSAPIKETASALTNQTHESTVNGPVESHCL